MECGECGCGWKLGRGHLASTAGVAWQSAWQSRCVDMDGVQVTDVSRIMEAAEA